MHYRFLNIFLFLFLFSCSSNYSPKDLNVIKKNNYFTNKGFALIFKDNLFTEKIVKGKIDDRSLIIFQKNLKKDTPVKITNLINSRNIIAKVGKKTEYPYFYNSVISKRISDELELDESEPYIEIKEILGGSSFIAKKAKTYDEEKKVAEKAPVDGIKIDNLGEDIKKSKEARNNNVFAYSIKIADFYYKDSAKNMVNRIINETDVRNPVIKILSKTKYRVLLGPFNDIKKLEKTFNDIKSLNFENIEILKDV